MTCHRETMFDKIIARVLATCVNFYIPIVRKIDGKSRKRVLIFHNTTHSMIACKRLVFIYLFLFFFTKKHY